MLIFSNNIPAEIAGKRIGCVKNRRFMDAERPVLRYDAEHRNELCLVSRLFVNQHSLIYQANLRKKSPF